MWVRFPLMAEKIPSPTPWTSLNLPTSLEIWTAVDLLLHIDYLRKGGVFSMVVSKKWFFFAHIYHWLCQCKLRPHEKKVLSGVKTLWNVKLIFSDTTRQQHKWQKKKYWSGQLNYGKPYKNLATYFKRSPFWFNIACIHLLWCAW